MFIAKLLSPSLAIAGVLLLAHPAPSGAEEVWQTLPPPAAIAVKPTASGMAPVNDIKMYYAVYGSGAPILFLHGGLGNTEYWANQINDFARTNTVIVADSRGHGRSTRSAQEFGYELMASDVVALLDHLHVDKVAIVGWSDGAILGLDIAMKHPERVSSLYSFAANYNLDGLIPDFDKTPTFAAYIVQAGKDYARISPTPGDYDNFLSAISRMWATQPNYPDRAIAAIRVPTTVSDGEHDEAIKQEHTKRIAALIPGSKLVILKGLSHFAMWQDPVRFDAAVRNAIDGK